MPKQNAPGDSTRAGAERLADIFTILQRCFVLNLSKELARGNVSFPQYLLLGHLAQAPLTMTEIANRMGHTTAAATGLIDRLERLGLVRRTHDTDDRRKVFVRINKPGLELVSRVKADMVENLMRMMGALTTEEQKMWVRIYEKVFELCQQKS